MKENDKQDLINSGHEQKDASPALPRRDFLKGAALVAASVMGGLPAPSSSARAAVTVEEPQPPASMPQGFNILFIVVDQERYFETYPFPVPGRERLLKNGVNFTFHENCANVCTSSRSVLYTGWHMPKTALFDNTGLPWMTNDLDPALGTLGTLLGEAGYYAAYKGKWHLSQELDHSNLSGGKVDIGMQPSPKFHKIMQGYGFEDYHGIGDVIGWSQGGYLYDSITTAQTVSWLRGKGQELNREGSPWFLAVNLINPHDVMFVDTDEPGKPRQWKGSLNNGGVSMNPSLPPDNEMYRATWNNVPLPASRHQPFNEPGRPAAHLEYQLARTALVGQFPDEDRRWRVLQNFYFNAIRDCDSHLVTILDEMDRLGLTDKTIVVFTSDHGELGGYHQMHGKGSSVYREQQQVPMIIAHPAYAGGKRCKALTCHLDVAPTLLGLTGIAPDKRTAILKSRQGRDFSPLLAAPEHAAVNAVREAALYCFGMIAYADAAYLKTIQSIKQRKDLDAEGQKQAMAKIRPDFRKRSAIRCVNDGRYKFARYFSLKEHNMPRTMEDLCKYNDLEIYDLRNDPGEMRNLALNLKKNADLVQAMSNKLNTLIEQEIGLDDGSYLPLSGMTGWELKTVLE